MLHVIYSTCQLSLMLEHSMPCYIYHIHPSLGGEQCCVQTTVSVAAHMSPTIRRYQSRHWTLQLQHLQQFVWPACEIDHTPSTHGGREQCTPNEHTPQHTHIHVQGYLLAGYVVHTFQRAHIGGEWDREGSSALLLSPQSLMQCSSPATVQCQCSIPYIVHTSYLCLALHQVRSKVTAESANAFIITITWLIVFQLLSRSSISTFRSDLNNDLIHWQ